MEPVVSKKMVNELLRNLGHQNIQVVEKPIFYWEGNRVTSDDTHPIKQVSRFVLSDEFSFSDFLTRYADKKIVISSQPDGGLVNSDNEIRVFIG